MEVSQGKKFEKPAPGMYLGTLVDIVDMPNVATAYGLKNRVRFHWVLANLSGQLYIGKDGTPVEAVAMWNANMGGRAELPKRLTQILGQAPPVITSTEQLEQLVLGRSNILVLVQSDNAKNPLDPYVNVDGIGPVQPGMYPPPVPQGYVRAKNRPKTVTGPNGQPVATYASPQAAAAAQPAAPAQPGYPYAPPAGVPPAYAPAPTAAPAPGYTAPNTVSLEAPAQPAPQGGNRPF